MRWPKQIHVENSVYGITAWTSAREAQEDGNPVRIYQLVTPRKRKRKAKVGT